ncbi:hypothetical protein Syun_008949 [Stephania yunnanensis]|uniref:DNA-directed RNA polymerase subunit n=1 Tax=Stephania yunnanensis TaxID=152371 RepID=A0AAP0PQG2_9MAGN
MYLKIQLEWNVLITPENLDPRGLLLQRSIIIRLLEEFANRKATKDHGYFLSVTTLEKIGEGKIRPESGDVLFPVRYNCLTFKPFKGEVLKGVVDRIVKHGVFLICGPVGNVFLSVKTMPDYQYVHGENPTFMNNESSKIEKGAVVRFVVLGTKWVETEKEFQVLASLAGDFLGPVS